jgi:hypothetical protein
MTVYCRERVRRVVGGVPAVLHNRQLEVLGRDQKFSHIDRPCMGDGWGIHQLLPSKPISTYELVGHNGIKVHDHDELLKTSG